MPGPRLFVDTALSETRLVTLGPERSHYLCRVLRLTAGDPLVVFDGAGSEYRATVVRADTRRCELEILQLINTEPEPALRLHLLQSLIKGDKLDFALQKATELGVTDIALMTTARSEVRLSAERMAKRMQHWRNVIASACEQCGRARMPQLHAPRPLQEVLLATPVDYRFLLEPNAAPMASVPDGDTALLVGPEGGFDDVERDLVLRTGAVTMGLGPLILRADTAPVAALAILRQAWGWRRP